MQFYINNATSGLKLPTFTPKGGRLVDATAQGLLPVKALESITHYLKMGDNARAKDLAEEFSKRVSPSAGDTICGADNRRDRRRPIVQEQRRIVTNLTPGQDYFTVAAAGITTVVGFLDTQINRTFLQANDTPVGVSPTMQPQVKDRLLVGLGVQLTCWYQPAPGGVVGAIDYDASRALTEEINSGYHVQIFPNSSRTPHHDSTPVSFYNSGETLLEPLRVLFKDERARIEIVPPGNAEAVGSTAWPAMSDGIGCRLTLSCIVSGLFVSPDAKNLAELRALAGGVPRRPMRLSEPM
jgi:hypothetical protein